MNILIEAAAYADDQAVLSLFGSQLEDVGFFDRFWYVEQYPDVAAAEIEPLTHFLTVGMPERRNPNRLFHALRSNGMADRRSGFCKRIAEAGSDPIRYYRRLQLAYRDFAIVCHVRSGSHLLATAINSHPEIHCQGELLHVLTEPHKAYAAVCDIATGVVNGAIIMYEQWELLRALSIIPSKIIHLTRDARQTALSFIRNNEHLSAYGARHNPHAWRNACEPLEMRDYPVDEKQLAERTALVRQSQHASSSFLPKSRLEVTYEELCGNHDVDTIEQTAADRIVEFLGVSGGKKMITPLRKTSSPLDELAYNKPAAASRPQRVLMVTSTLAVGGCERQMLTTAEGLAARGYQLQIFELAEIPAQFGFEAEFWKLGVQSLRACDFYDDILWRADERTGHVLARFSALLDHVDIVQLGKALRRAIEEFQPDIVHCWSDPANIIGGLVANEVGVPRIVLSHRNVPPSREAVSRPDLYREAHRHLMQQPNVAVLSNSDTNRVDYERWLDAPRGAINLVYNGFSPRSIHIRGRRESALCRRALGLNEDALVVGAVMRFVAEKDPILWLDTAAAIGAQRQAVRFLLAGYGELADCVAGKVQALGLADRVILPGPTLDVGSIYGAMDLFLLTSRREGVPNVLIEAQAAGVPVVAPRVGGVTEAVLHGKTGLIAEDRSVAGLASAVLTILANRYWEQSASVYGPTFVAERFGQARMVDETIALYGTSNRAGLESARDSILLRSAQLWRASAERIGQLEAMIARERRNNARHVADLEQNFAAERQAAATRVWELDQRLKAEHDAFVARIRELETRLEAENHAFVARIRELEADLENERSGNAAQIADADKAFAAERQAAATRVWELDQRLKAEHDAFVARIRELESDLENERSANAAQIADAHKTFGAEREAAMARIRELEATLIAERDASVARIRELKATLAATRAPSVPGPEWT
jgi:glycosyltransferase involved in cell wall biosynthesis/cytochrome c556